jgi:hypothetical protein
MMYGSSGMSPTRNRLRIGLLVALVALVAATSLVALLVGQMPQLPFLLAGAGALFGLTLAVYEGIRDRARGDAWWALLVYPLMMLFVTFLCGLLILLVYNLIVHRFVGLDYP